MLDLGLCLAFPLGAECCGVQTLVLNNHIYVTGLLERAFKAPGIADTTNAES